MKLRNIQMQDCSLKSNSHYGVLTILLVVAGLAGIFAAGYWFRDSLARQGANYLLADQQMTVTRLQGLEIGTRHIDISGMDLALPSGQQVLLADVSIGFSRVTLTKAPVISSVVVSSARLVPALTRVEQGSTSTAAGSPMSLDELLLLLRELPGGDIAIATLELPQWPELLSFDLQHANSGFNARIGSDTMLLSARFRQVQATSIAHLDMQLSLGDASAATARLSLQPQQDDWSLLGKGHLQWQSADLDRLLARFMPGPLPGLLDSARFDWEISGTMVEGSRGAGAAVFPGSGKFQVSTPGLQLNGLPGWIPMIAMDASLVIDQDGISFDTPLVLRNVLFDPGMRVNGNYNFGSGTGSVYVAIPHNEFRGKDGALSDMFHDWPYSFDLLSGSLQAELSFHWRTARPNDAGGEKTFRVKAVLRDIAGFYDDIYFRGLNGEPEGTVDATGKFAVTTPPLTISITRVDVGLPLDNLVVRFRIEEATQHLLVDSFYSETLGGTVIASNVSYVPGAALNTVNVQFSGLRLDHMLDLVGYKGIQASGAVSGELPLTFSSQGVEIVAGRLHADEPGGSIHYQDDNAAGRRGNTRLNLVNQALSNYQFDTLVSNIDYTPEGLLLLSMQMRGSNPDLENGQGINLNLELSDNIPALLESLQALRAIEDFLEQ